MSDKLSQLERLNKLLDEGRISDSEYTDLKAEVFEKRPDEEIVSAPSTDDRADEPGPTPTITPTRADTPAIYKVALGGGIVSIFFGGTFGLLAWATVALGIAALLSEKTAHRRWMAWTGLALGLVFSFMNAYLNGHLDRLSNPATVAPSTETSLADIPTTTGISPEEFIVRWNDAQEQLSSECSRDPSCTTVYLPVGSLDFSPSSLGGYYKYQFDSHNRLSSIDHSSLEGTPTLAGTTIDGARIVTENNSDLSPDTTKGLWQLLCATVQWPESLSDALTVCDQVIQDGFHGFATRTSGSPWRASINNVEWFISVGDSVVFSANDT